MPAVSKRATARRSVRSAVPVSWARSAVGCPKSTIGRKTSSASCSGEPTSRRSCAHVVGRVAAHMGGQRAPRKHGRIG